MDTSKLLILGFQKNYSHQQTLNIIIKRTLIVGLLAIQLQRSYWVMEQLLKQTFGHLELFYANSYQARSLLRTRMTH